MTWIPLVTLATISIVLVGLWAWQRRRQINGANRYRERYVHLVAQLDAITAVANQLEGLAKEIKNNSVLDAYETNLRSLETLLVAIRSIPPFGTDASMLDSAQFLARDSRERMLKTQKAFRDVLGGRDVDLKKLSGSKNKTITTGCYFCSRPIAHARVRTVRVKIDDDVREVVACQVCRHQLETTKKVKVLYFMKNGKPVHWSKVADYRPHEDYWHLNDRKPVQKERRLELVYSSHQKPLRPPEP